MSGKEFEVKEEVYALEPEEHGDSFKSFALIEGESEEDNWEYVSFRTGDVEKKETADGENMLIKNVEESMSLGTVEYIDSVQEALGELVEKID